MSSKESERHTEECAAYFAGRMGYHRALLAMRKKWKQYGRATGTIVIDHPTREEWDALEGLFSKEFQGTAIRFSVKDFQKALEQTRFGHVDLGELLSVYFQERLTTNQEERELAAQEKRDFFQKLSHLAWEYGGRNGMAAKWMEELTERKKYGYHLILRFYEKDPGEAFRQTEYVCKALHFLERKPGVRLAVLAAEVTGNPHEFDRNTFAGKLLIQALSFCQGGMSCQNAEEVLMLYYASGIKPDDISSFVTAYGIHCYTQEGEHPAYSKFIQAGESYVITLSNLGRVVRADACQKRVFVVENQMVFSYLCEALGGQEVGLVCTSGQIKTASWMLLDLLCESGCEIYYCGDLDPEGLGIAQKLITRHPDHAVLWHMTEEDYRTSVSDEKISQERLHKLDKITLPCLKNVRAAVLSEGKAGYQEQLLEELLADLISTFSS